LNIQAFFILRPVAWQTNTDASNNQIIIFPSTSGPDSFASSAKLLS